MDYIQDFNDTFYLYDGKIDVTETSNIVEWYTKYESTVEYYNSRVAINIQKPPMPQFTLSEEKNEQIAYQLYVFGIKLYNDQKDKCCHVHPQGYCTHAYRGSRLPPRFRKSFKSDSEESDNEETQ